MSRTNSTVNPSWIKKSLGDINPKFRYNDQINCEDLITTFLDALHDDLNTEVKRRYLVIEPMQDNESEREAAERYWKLNLQLNSSFIVDLFHGQLKNQIECLTCHSRIVTFKNYDILQLEIPSRVRSNRHLWFSKNYLHFDKDIEIKDCFQLFNSKTSIIKSLCEKCHGENAALTDSLYSANKVLIVNLNRYSEGDNSNEKINKMVRFDDHVIDLKDSIIDNCGESTKYELYAIAEHRGSYSGGKWTAKCKTDYIWSEYRDSFVSEISLDEICSSNSRVLFYRRIDN